MTRVVRKIDANHFIIKSSVPNVEISWQVTGIRKDAFAQKNRVVPEVEKSANEKGKYLHPGVCGIYAPSAQTLPSGSDPAAPVQSK